MSEWKEYKLGKYGDVLGGYAFKSEDFSTNGIPVIKIKNVASGSLNMSDSQFYPHKINDRLNRFIVNKNDILIAMTGSHISQPSSMVGKVARYNADYQSLLNQRVGKVYSKSLNFLDDNFLYYYLKQTEITIELALNGSGSGNQANISSEQIKDLNILLPPIQEQKAIASVLSSLDNKIDLLHRQNQTLEAMAETLFRQWFIEEAEESWEKGKLGDIAILFNGKTRPKIEGEIPVYGGNGILGFGNETNFTGKSIIIGRVGAYCGSLYYEDRDIWVSDNALLLKPLLEIHIHYIFYLLKSFDLNSMAEGSSHPLLTQTLLKSIEITIPPNEKIESFDNQLSNWKRKIKSNNIQVNTLTQLRDTLLPKLMSGEVRVNEK